MMASSTVIVEHEERDNFFHLTLLLFRLGNTKLREYLKSQWSVAHLKASSTTPKPWSDTPPDAAALKKIGKLKFHFIKQEKLFDTGKTNDWDFSLLSLVLLSAPYEAVLKPAETKALKKMKEIRNTLICHASDARITDAVFQIEWTKACAALKEFKATQDEFDAVEEDIKKSVDVLLPMLKECSKMEDKILQAVIESEESAKDRHKEVMDSISNLTEKVESLNTPRPKIRRLQMQEDHRILLQERLPNFQNDIIVSELLQNLPCLTEEQKNDITYDENNYLSSKAVKTLVEKLEEYEEGFRQFVSALRKAGRGCVAVLLDGDHSGGEDEDKAQNEEELNYFIDDKFSVVDIPVTMHLLMCPEEGESEEMTRQPRLEDKIARSFGANPSPEHNELRKDFEERLPQGVYFVHTKTSNDPDGGVRIIFRTTKTSCLDQLWTFYEEKQLEGLLKIHLVSKTVAEGQHGESNQELNLKVTFKKKEYDALKRILNGENKTEEPETSIEAKEEAIVDEAMETEAEAVLPKRTTRSTPRTVYLDDGTYSLSRELKLRDYQKELAAPALEGKNTIICAPTNSGKTYVAMEIAKRHLDAYKQRQEVENEDKEPKVVFVVDKQNLVLQQKGRFEEYLTNYSTSDITGADAETQYVPLEILLKGNDIVVLTAQILVNALKDKKVVISDISLLVFDECHHANKEHPYNKIMQEYLDVKINGSEPKRLPQVIGLTASLGVGQTSKEEKAKEHVLRMCANLDASNISTVREHEEELGKAAIIGNVHDCKSIQIHKESDIFEQQINKTMEEIEVFIKTSSSFDPPKATDRQAESYRQWIELLENNASTTQNNDQFVCAQRLRRYHEALLINSNVRIEDAILHLEDYFFKTLDKSKFTKTESWLQKIFLKAKEHIDGHNRDANVPQNPLLLKLQEQIKEFHSKTPEESQAKGILFTRTRDYACALKRWMEESVELKDILKPEVLLGSAALTQNQQEQVIQRFKEGSTNIIIATTVAEEGLDIPTCSYVIRYGVKGNEIAYVQSRGRVRAEEGKYVHLSDAKSRGAEHERRNEYREMLMTFAVAEAQNMDKEDFLKKINTLQVSSIRVLKRKQQLQEEKKSQLTYVDEGVTFYCKKCNALVCHVQDIRRFADVHHVVINRDIYERIDIKPHPKPDTFDKIYFGKKILCKKCGHDWGVIITVEDTEWPCLKVVSLVLDDGKRRKLFKKWKALPFKIRETTLEEMMETTSNDKHAN